MKKQYVLALLFSLVAGCTKEDPVSVPPLPLPPSMNGSWIAVAPGQFTLTLSLSQEKTTVSGYARLTDQSGSYIAGGIGGTNKYPSFSLVFSSLGFQPLMITGSFVDPSTANIELNESGFQNFGMLLQRQ